MTRPRIAAPSNRRVPVDPFFVDNSRGATYGEDVNQEQLDVELDQTLHTDALGINARGFDENVLPYTAPGEPQLPKGEAKDIADAIISALSEGAESVTTVQVDGPGNWVTTTVLVQPGAPIKVLGSSEKRMGIVLTAMGAAGTAAPAGTVGVGIGDGGNLAPFSANSFLLPFRTGCADPVRMEHSREMWAVSLDAGAVYLSVSHTYR